jgi:DNA-binding NtrC family response regulator
MKEHGGAPTLRVLIVDDELLSQRLLMNLVKQAAAHLNLDLQVADSEEPCLSVCASQNVDLVLLDKGLKTGENGLDLIPKILALQPHAQVVMVTGSRDIQDVVRAMKRGAFGYICKSDTPEMLALIERGVRAAELGSLGQRTQPQRLRFGTRSPLMRQVIYRAKAFAESDRPILIMGETGSGKTLLAQMIHEHRNQALKRSESPFISLNINALSMDVIERELFGSEKGAFTDAKDRKLGFFELADGGTLFLDEIGDAQPSLQVKLLKVLEEKKFYRLGGSRIIHSKFKLICATHRNLEQLVREGKFREDLYMRISTFPLLIPPLKERKEDIPEIIRSALPTWCEENHVNLCFDEVPADFIDYLTKVELPGNVRAIEHLFSRVMVLSQRNTNGQPLLTDWRQVLGVTNEPLPVDPQMEKSMLTLQDLLTLPFDVVGANFPGLHTVLQAIESKILQDAEKKYATHKEMALALKTSQASISIKMKQIHQRSAYSKDSILCKQRSKA